LIPHSKPTLSLAEEAAVAEVIRSGQVAQGPQVAAFERRLAAYVGAPHAVATSSGTAALHLCLCALDVGPGDEVALPSYVCASLLHAVSHVGARPLLVDIEKDTFNLDMRDLERKITPRTKAIVLPHLFGLPADLEAAKSFGVTVIEDCAMAIGARYESRPVGGLADLAVFSFYATKMVCCGEGGMVAARSGELAARIADMREYDEKADYKPRFNYKMTDMQAAMGSVQLERLDDFVRRRRAIAKHYAWALRPLNIILPGERPGRTHAYFRYVMRTQRPVDQAITALEEHGVSARRPVFAPIHRLLGQDASAFPNSETAFESALSIPIYPGLTDDQVALVVEACREVL